MSSLVYPVLNGQTFPDPLGKIGGLPAIGRNKAWTRVGQTIEDKIQRAQSGNGAAYAEAIHDVSS